MTSLACSILIAGLLTAVVILGNRLARIRVVARREERLVEAREARQTIQSLFYRQKLRDEFSLEDVRSLADALVTARSVPTV